MAAAALAPALVTGGASLFGGLMGQAAESERQKRQLEVEAALRAAEMQKEAGQQLAQGSQNAFGQLMNQYRSVFIR